MRALVQRVRKASVNVDGKTTGEITGGLLILIGVTHSDTEQSADYLAEKCANLRIFSDENGKMNLSLLDTAGGALVISQFTLYGDTRKGRRPGFADAALPEPADKMYQYFTAKLKSLGVNNTQNGVFGADMLVSLENDGPVTFMLESPDK